MCGAASVRTRVRSAQESALFRTFLTFFVYNRENAMKLSGMTVILMMMLSCAASSSAPKEPWRVSVTSSGGVAGRGAGSFAINSDGEISVRTMMGRSCTLRASDADLQRFRELLANARPETWDASYVPENSCCDRFEYELTLDQAGTEKTVKWIDDPMPMPKDLEALTNAMVGPPPSLRVDYGGKCTQ